MTSSTFSFTDPCADDDAITTMSSTAIDALAVSMMRGERRHLARKVLLAGRIGQIVLDEMLHTGRWIDSRINDAAAKAAIGAITARLGVPLADSGRWLRLAIALDGFTGIRHAFLAGEFDLRRTEILVRELAVISDPDLRAHAEQIALQLAGLMQTDRTLTHRLAEMVIAVDPDAAAGARDFIQRQQQLSIRDEMHGHVTINGLLPAELGVHLTQQIHALIDLRVCRHDPRTRGQQRVAAFAELTGMPGAYLACECGSADCSRAIPLPDEPPDERDIDGPDVGGPDSPAPNEPAPNNPAPREPAPNEPDPESDGPLPDEPVAEPDVDNPDCDGSADATDADSVGENSEAGAPTDSPASGRAPVPTRRPAPTDARAQAPAAASAQTALTVLLDPSGMFPPRLVGYGPIHPAHAAQIVSDHHATNVLRPATNTTNGSATTTQVPTWQRVTAITLRGPAPPLDPTGHGSHPAPPRWALTYRPPKWLVKRIQHRDGICRAPGCHRPAEDCQIDHLVKFLHRDPVTGGWSVEGNLIALCPACHQRKHLGILIPTMLADRTIVWRNPTTGDTITTHPL
ncbi:MAG: HNH endonuclease [Gordonia sp. (in: high G+C Gram-positive bacteria)]